jgi:hypothetical protein
VGEGERKRREQEWYAITVMSAMMRSMRPLTTQIHRQAGMLTGEGEGKGRGEGRRKGKE